MSNLDSHLEIALASIKCFTDDGKLDIGELNFLLGLALRDEKVDDEERRVFKNIFSQISKSGVSEVVWNRILEVKKLYGI